MAAKHSPRSIQSPPSSGANANATFSWLLEMRNAEPAKFENLNLWEYYQQVMPEQYNSLQEAQNELRAESRPVKPNALASFTAQAKTRLRQELKITKTELVDDAIGLIHRLWLDEQANLKDTATQDDFDRVLDRAFKQVLIDVDLISDDFVPAFEITEETEIGELPDEVDRQIRQRISAEGREPTDFLIKRAYRNMLLNQARGR